MERRTILIDEKIEKAKESVARAKVKYDSAVDEVEKLMAKRDAMKKEELITAVVKSSKSYDEIMEFLKTDN